jgi:hypothetical protein
MAVKRKKNNKLLIGLGIAGALVGIGIFTYPSLKKLFKPEEKIDPTIPQNTLPDTNTNTNIPTNNNQEVSTLVKDPTIDIYKKNKVGTKSKEVTAIQTIINLISQLRGTYGKTVTVEGKALKLPIGLDGDFGNKTKLGALYTFPTFKDSGFVTLYNARKKFAYATGFYNQGFPSNLIGTAKEEDYRNAYMIGKADGKEKKITDYKMWRF